MPSCFDRLRRAGLVLRPLEDGIAVYADDSAIGRLRRHVDAAGGSLGMAFQVFFTDPHFFDYTTPAWPSGKLLFLDTADSVTDESGRRVVHATPFVDASAFLERDHARLGGILGERVLAPTPAMVIQVAVTPALLDVVDVRQRHFHIRFDTGGKRPKDERAGTGEHRGGNDGAPGGAGFSRFAVANIADHRRAHVFPPKGAMLAREVASPRLRPRQCGPAAERISAAGAS
ncbi:hypothetical protein LK542_17475 [Massilia sp. IC2-477]|uniref:hypothetical protein n=1 Tax=Massilia sp. IC2-477 TaxID=2887198 RepID=UPI001D117B55|nr:hypothetical protein [Massilia sp. IC2-477]MCC2957410.1 hypothetical protein [Massilia sp. IC2-477]